MFVASLLVALSTGVLIAIAGLVMMWFPPKKINRVYGYRTTRSFRNQRAWDFAQRHSARTMLSVGIANAAVSGAVFCLFVWHGFSGSTLCGYCAVLQPVLSIPTVLAVLIPTEIALKRLEAEDARKALG